MDVSSFRTSTCMYASTPSWQQSLAVERRIPNRSINTIFNVAAYPIHNITMIYVMHFICSAYKFLLDKISVTDRETVNFNDTLNLMNITDIFTIVVERSDYHLVQPVMIMIGLLRNLITILCILMNKKLRKPFYYCIVNMALRDMISLLSIPHCRKISVELFPGLCTHVNFTFIFETIKQSSGLFSGTGVLILGYVRYPFLLIPSKVLNT